MACGVMISTGAPLKVELVMPAKLVPVTVMIVPAFPLVGEKLLMVGAGTKVKFVALLTVPPAVVTLISPVEAPAGTSSLTILLDQLVIVVTATPLNLAAVTPLRLVPVAVTSVPTPPEAGVKEVMVGGNATKVI